MVVGESIEKNLMFSERISTVGYAARDTQRMASGYSVQIVTGLGAGGEVAARMKRSLEEQEIARKRWRDNARKWRTKNPERSRELSSEERWRCRVEVLEAYGGKCECCGESNPKFLVIDHIDGGGAAHRKENGGDGDAFYRRLRREGFPKEGLRVLCHNCNGSLAHYGYCPHERERNVAA